MWRKLTAICMLPVLLVPGTLGVHDRTVREELRARQLAALAQGRQVAAERDRAMATVMLADRRDAAQAQTVQLAAALTQTAQQRDQALQDAASLKQQVDDLKAQVAALSASASGLGAVTTAYRPGSIANTFAFGYCTWYVASRRPIPWRGNAIEWWANARAYGFAEGQAPHVGAIEVSSASWWGHVMYVEAVYGPDSWLVSEMNYTAWNVVDQRVVSRYREPLIGFVY